MTKQELIEQLADIEHQRWSDWQRYQHSQMTEGAAHNGRVLNGGLYSHWERLIATDYADLPEHSKQSDRDQVMRYLPLIVEFVADFITDKASDCVEGESLASHWRREMS